VLRLCAVVGLLGACAPVDGPQLDGIDPGAAARGQTVRVGGVGFCGGRDAADGSCASPPSGAVDFGLRLPSARAAVVAWGELAIDVVVPDAVDRGATTVYVTVDGRSSNGLSFEVLP
jgi:hypothetical protein